MAKKKAVKKKKASKKLVEASQSVTQAEQIEQSIYTVRGHRVMLDADLATLYEVETRSLVQAVSRNKKNFPADFMFQLTRQEWESLRSQSVILKRGRGQHRKFMPYAFTEQGVSMLSSVLRSDRAIEVNIGIMRAFVRYRQTLAVDSTFAKKLAAMEKKYDAQFSAVFKVLRALMAKDDKPAKQIGFRHASGKKK